MESNFNGITLWSAATQLNTEISVLIKDLLNSFSRLNATGLLSAIQTIFNDKIDLREISKGTFKLNLCHLFGLMFYYECTIQLTHISKLLNKHATFDHDYDYNDIDFNILELFQQQNKDNKHKLCHQMLNHINQRCKHQRPILLYYGDNTKDINTNNITKRNDKIWTECKSKKIPIKSKTSSKPRVRSHSRSMRKINIPKKKMPPYHDKKYHLFGRRHHLPLISETEIQKHNTKESCWIIVNGLVLDVTAFLPYHPASMEGIIKNSAQNCDTHFKFHSKKAQKLMMKFVIGRMEKNNECVIQ